MPVTGPIPNWVLSIAAAATIFTVMFGLGLEIAPGEFRWVWRRPGLMVKALFSVLVAVPVLALVVTRALDLPRAVEVGIVLMAISPGAPVALRRSLAAGGHRAFAPALQIALAALAVASMPLSVAVLDEYYQGRATVAPEALARQVFFAQLLPLSLGVVTRYLSAGAAAWLAPRLARLGTMLLLLLVVLALIDIWKIVIDAGSRVASAIVVVTLAALAIGHLLGGPDPATRTASAISSALRNPGLAFLVATVNGLPAATNATVVAYFVIAAFIVLPYVFWRRRATATGADPQDNASASQ